MERSEGAAKVSTPEPYEAPRVESVKTGEELEREAQYGGASL